MSKPAIDSTSKPLSAAVIKPAGVQAMTFELYHQVRLAIEELERNPGSKKS